MLAGGNGGNRGGIFGLAGGTVEFKANANGLVIVFDRDEGFDEIYGQIARKLESSGYFFQTRYLVTQYRGRQLSAGEEGAIIQMMAEKTGARTVIFEMDRAYGQEAARGAASALRPGQAGGGGAGWQAGRPQAHGGGGASASGGGYWADGPDGAGAGGSAGIGLGAAARGEAPDPGGWRGPDAYGPDAYGQNGRGATAYGANSHGAGDRDGPQLFGPQAFERGEAGGGYASGSAGGGGNAYSGSHAAGDYAAGAAPDGGWGRGADLDECMTKYARGTLRSGMVVSYEGNVVVVGDVNPGAEVEATGNVIVLGTLRGIVHAGASGDRRATVIALNLRPTQLRIADIITRRQPFRSIQKPAPEIASIKDGTIVVEALLPAAK